jgi:hypothetical protein
MEIIFGIIGLVLVVAVPFFIYMWRKRNERPRVEIHFQEKGGSSRPLGLSDANDFSTGAVESHLAIRLFVLEYNFEIKLVNNSDFVAYYPKLHEPVDGVSLTHLERVLPGTILNSTPVTLKAGFIAQEECRGSERSNPRDFPKDLMGYCLLLEYQNNHGTKFFSFLEFDSSNRTSQLCKKLTKNMRSKFNVH